MGKKKTVIYTGSTMEQRTYNHYTGDWNCLVIGAEYELVNVVVHAWHTEYFLKGIKGSFNSVCFETKEEIEDRIKSVSDAELEKLTGYIICEYPPEAGEECEGCKKDNVQLYFSGTADAGSYLCRACVEELHRKMWSTK